MSQGSGWVLWGDLEEGVLNKNMELTKEQYGKASIPLDH